jgi:hypothetical protein
VLIAFGVEVLVLVFEDRFNTRFFIDFSSNTGVASPPETPRRRATTAPVPLTALGESSRPATSRDRARGASLT